MANTQFASSGIPHRTMTEDPASEPIPLRMRLAVYGAGMFSDGVSQVVVPLWLISLKPTPFEFGLVMGARAFLPFLLSIHGGALMDRLGARQVMLFFAGVGLVLPILFPLLPWIMAACFLQLILGLTTTMSWVGAQTLVGQVMKGNAGFAGHVSFSNRLGSLICPLVAGASWDTFGPWGGFGVMFCWTVLLLISALMLPKRLKGAARGRFTVRDIVPRVDDYVRAFSLLAIPAVSIVAIGSVLNIATGAIQNSFYIAYLEKIGLSGTLIGTLVTVSNVAALLGTVGFGRVIRRVGEIRVLNASVVGAIIAITVTPFLTTLAPLLGMSLFRGWSVGVGQPLMISIPSKAVSPGAHGAAVGLRIALNRLVQTVLPPLMGGVVGLIGLEASFVAIGGTLLVLVSLFVAFLGIRGAKSRVACPE
jgi:MFS family permease